MSFLFAVTSIMKNVHLNITRREVKTGSYSLQVNLSAVRFFYITSDMILKDDLVAFILLTFIFALFTLSMSRKCFIVLRLVPCLYFV